MRAEVFWQRGQPKEALSTLEHAQFWTRQELGETGDSPIYSHVHERFARAELSGSGGATESDRALHQLRGLWRECDPGLRPQVQQAESALARLR